MTLLIQKIQELPLNYLVEMITESKNSGFRAISRMVDEWICGTNRFDGLGEALFIAQENNYIIGICGLNRDPYANSSKTGRVRRLYVMHDYRQRKIGSALVKEVIAEAYYGAKYEWLHVRTDNSVAAQFYCSLGFAACPGYEHFTHRFNLGEYQ
jgi:ribosomal protein S18 acetylase RimI-like enzyme